MLVPVGVLELTGPFARELGVPVPQPETSSIPMDVTPTIWAERCPSERNIKGEPSLKLAPEKGISRAQIEEIAGRVTCPSGLSQSHSGN
jgi:hypothetical protein